MRPDTDVTQAPGLQATQSPGAGLRAPGDESRPGPPGRLDTRLTLDLPSGKRLLVGARPLLMGVLNVTPDSFSDGGRFLELEAAVARGLALVAEGADLIDIGGESTRPGGAPVSEAEEVGRVLPVVERLARGVAVPLSVDTYRAATAARALEAGADIVNDVTALRADPDMGAAVARRGAAVVLMHATGLPGGFHDPAVRGAPLERIVADLAAAVRQAEAAGIAPERIFVDPGIGFGKTQAENLAVLRDLARLRALGKPIVVGPSMKSFIARALGEADTGARASGEGTSARASGADTGARACGTAAAVAIAAFLGAEVIRVHDVAAMRRVARVADAIRTAGRG